MSDKCVFTTLIGGYEHINEQPVAAASGIPFICLTDDPDLRCDGWEMRVVKPVFPSDPVRSQRDLKIRSHTYLPEFSRSLYIDNSVVLKQQPDHLFELAATSPHGFLMPRHSYRKTVHDEFLEIVQVGYDDSNRVFEQLNHYLLNFPEVLNERPWWTAIIVRDHNNPHLRVALDVWAMHVMRYSRRDQLSINMALHLAGVQPEPLLIDNFELQFHSWPHSKGRDRHRGERNPTVSLMPLATRLRFAERQLEKFTAEAIEFGEKIQHLNQEIARLGQEKALLDQERALINQQNAHLATGFAELSATHQAVLDSTSWRLTKPLRNLMGRMPMLHGYFRRARRVASGAASVDPPGTTAADNAAANTSPPSHVDRVIGPKGYCIHVDPDDGRAQRLIAAGGSLNPPTLTAWQLLLDDSAWTHIIDVGANYGEMLVNVELPHDAKVIAVEPSPAIRAKLEQTLRDAGIRADILAVALSDSEGIGNLFIDSAWSGTTRLVRPEEAGQPIRTSTLGAVLRGAQSPLPAISALIKIDVEGHEAQVLRGGMEELAALRNFAVLVEVLHAATEDLEWLEQNFDIEMLRLADPATLVPVPRGQFGKMVADNALYPQDVVLRPRK